MDTEIAAERELALMYADYAQPILRYLRQLTGSHELAEDLMQETFVKALRARAQREVDDVRPWLFRIARNAAYDAFRRERIRATTPLTEAHAQTLRDPAGLAIDETEPIRAALAQLPALSRHILLLHSCAGYQLRDIVAILGIKEGTVKSRLHRARAQFRRLYQGYGPEPLAEAA